MLNLFSKINVLPEEIASIFMGILENDEQESYFDDLLEVLRELPKNGDNIIFYLLFTVLVEIYDKITDVRGMTVINTARINAITQSPVSLSDTQLKEYLNAVHKISQMFTNELTSEYIEENNISLESVLQNIYVGHFYKNQSTDALGMMVVQHYYQPVPIKCYYCGHEVQRFDLLKEKIKPLQKFEHTAYHFYVVWRMIGLERIDFESASNDTHLLYGTCMCKKCKKRIVPIKANSYFFLAENGYKTLTLEEIQGIEKNLLEELDLEQEDFHAKILLYGDYVANLYWDSFGYDCLHPYPYLLKVATTMHQFWGDDYLRLYINSAVASIEKHKGEYNKFLGDVYFATGTALNKIDEPDYLEVFGAIEYFINAMKCYLESCGVESKEYHLAEFNVLLSKARRSESESDIKKLLEFYDFMKKSDLFDKAIITKAGHDIALIVADENIKLAISLDENYIKFLIAQVGEDNIALIDARNDLADLYIKGEKYKKALTLLNKSLKILTKEAGGQKVVAAVLKGNVDSLDLQLKMRVIEFIAYTMGNIANIYLLEYQPHKAFDFYKDALTLYQSLPIVCVEEILDKHIGLAVCYKCLGDKDEAMACVKFVIKTNKDFLKNEDYEDSWDAIKSNLSVANKLFKEIKLMD